MTYNLRFDKFKKEINGEVWGAVLVTFSQKSKTKVVSTGKRIKRTHYDKYLNKDFKRFIPTTVIDSKSINAEIDYIVANKDPFTKKTIQTVHDGYIAFMTNELRYVANLSTRQIYGYVVQSFVEYLESIDPIDSNKPTDIPLNELNLDLFRGYKAYLDGKLSFGTIKYYLTLHRSFIANAFDQYKTEFILSLKRFKLENNGKKPTVLTDGDIDILRKVERIHPLFNIVQFSMLQLFSNGIRFGDCLLIKFSDFKSDYLEIHQMKTNRVLQVPYSPMLIETVSIILGFDYTPSDDNLQNTLNDLLSDVNDEKIINGRRDFVLNYIHSIKKDRFLFEFVDHVLFGYKKGTNMTAEQHQIYNLHRVNHNNHLTKLRKQLKLSVPTLSSHSMRYAYTRISLENGIPLRTLSQSLGHSSVSITENYIRNNFQLDNYKIIGEMMTMKYKVAIPEKIV